MESTESTHEGGCHCGAVRFRVRIERRRALECNCSMCVRKGFLHLIVPPEDFELLRGGDALGTYTFNTGVAKHRFCRTCGIHPFYTPRSHPEHVDVNVRCLDDVELERFTVDRFDGRNWEQSVARLRPVASIDPTGGIMSQREFKDVRGSGAECAEALPVDEFMAGLEALQAEVATARNAVWPCVADGSLSDELLRRLCKEYYFLGKWFTCEFGSIVSNAPDVDALDLQTSEHFQHWSQNLADEMGFAGDRNHVDMKVEWARMLKISDRELLEYRPMPETIGAVFTTLYYMRRSYEEGLAAFGWAGERFAASTNYARMMYEGMRDHYGIEVENFKVHAYAEEDHGRQADFLLRQVATTAGQQRRIRRAVEHVLVCRNARTEALNRWLDEPGARRRRVA